MKIMKTISIKHIIAAFSVGCVFVASIALTSCTDLDSDKYFGDRKTLESVFTDEIQANQWLAHAYAFLGGSNFEVCSKGATGNDGGNWNPFNFADDMYYGDRDNTFGDSKDADYASYNSFHEGNYTEAVGQNAWVRCYQGIYQASVFIHHIGINKRLSANAIEDYRGQARFVRAYFYWLLLRKFGPVPIMADEGADYTLEYDELATPRSTYEECATYIADQMLQAAKELKYTRRDESNAMRPTIGAALATRAIVLTYAASPLANGQLQNGHHPSNVTDDVAKQLRNFDGTPLLSLTYDESKWARAAAACKDVMDLGIYDLYVDGFDDQTEGGDYPKSVTPPYDAEFSEKNWPDGWKNIDPYKSYCKLFNGSVSPVNNPELIFTRGNMNKNDHDNGIGSLVIHSMPVSLNGWNTHGLTQKMVDTYYMKDGSDADGMYREWRQPGEAGNDRMRPTGFITRDEARNNAYPEVPVWHNGASSLQMSQRTNVSKQYVGREPRFYASVAYNGTIWQQLENNSQSLWGVQVTYYRAGTDGYKNSFSYLRTGIGVKKYYNPHDWINAQNSYDHICEKYEPAIRYADILLMYAECLNELTQGQTYQQKDWKGNDIVITGRDISEMKRGIRPVRIRAGLPDYTADVYNSQDDLRAKIKRERMIEFMGEGKRYFDLRRWMDAPVEENKRVYGLNVFQTAQNRDEFMQVIPVYNLSATFTDKMYFWPISFTDLKRNKNLVQNPGWKYND
jgi:hypothetical protein